MSTAGEDAGNNLPAQTNQLGKRYCCEHCGVEVLCLTAGSGRFMCHDTPMKIIQLSGLPASD